MGGNTALAIPAAWENRAQGSNPQTFLQERIAHDH
jgi:hypothetical protein